MKEFLLKLLADPITGKQLTEVKNAENHFISSDADIYSVVDGVPILLPKQKSQNTNSPLHQDMDSNFAYENHYEEDAQFFNYFDEPTSAATKEEIRRLNQTILHQIPNNSEIILDVGCGNGWLAKHCLPKEKKVVSLDISIKNPTTVLKENPSESHAAVVADAYHLPFKENAFDVIVASEIIEHVYDPKLFIQRLLKVLKPGGTLIITTPYNEKIEYFLCVHCNKPTPKNAHLHSFNEQNIIEHIPVNEADYSLETFSNKYLIRLRLNLLIKFFPYKLWKMFDSNCNSIKRKPTRFLIVLKKKN